MGGSATSPAIADDSSVGRSPTGAALMGGSSSMVGGRSVAGADQQPAPYTAAGA